jgi:hypothetical protein
MGRVRWSHVTIALALIAAVAIAAPAIGGSTATTAGTVSKKTLKKLIKKEVSKQIVKAKGPAGPAGTNGTNGTNGIDGTARAYAVVHGSFCALPPPTSFCALTRNKGVAYAAHVANGTFCVGVNGISADDPATIAVVAPTVGGASTRALWLGASVGNRDCVGSEFEVITGEGDGPLNRGTDFTILIP